MTELSLIEKATKLNELMCACAKYSKVMREKNGVTIDKIAASYNRSNAMILDMLVWDMYGIREYVENIFGEIIINPIRLEVAIDSMLETMQ